MDKFIKDLSTIFSNPKYFEEFGSGIAETLYSTVIATAAAFVLGLLLAVLLVVGDKGGVRPLPGPLMKLLNTIINVLRSVPFLILMLFILPLSKVIVGTTVGTPASIPPLIIAAAPFVARLVETTLRELDHGVLEAAQAMGASPVQIVWKVMLPECLPSLISGFTTAFITILGYGAMAGAIGGGGLGKIAINYGYNKYNTAVMLVATVLIVILVQIAQSIGTRLSVRLDRRNRNQPGKNRKKGGSDIL
jgi:D-methionine transport system permease protein